MNSIFYENSKTPKFVDSNAKLPSAAKEALEMASENARLLNSFLKDADSTADKLAVAPKSMQNIKMQVKKQILNNMKLLNMIKEINQTEKEKEVENARNNIISELKNEINKQSLLCNTQSFTRGSPKDISTMKKDYYLNKKPFQVNVKLESNYDKLISNKLTAPMMLK